MPSTAITWARPAENVAESSGRSAAPRRTNSPSPARTRPRPRRRPGVAAEIAPVTVKTRKGDVVVDTDEYIRHGATLDSDGQAAPRLQEGWRVTAANASGLNDGAAVRAADERRRSRKARR
jgi:acetyl-CoA C-acetyltransferase